MLDLSPGDPQLRHVDRAWASTVHAFQGRTIDTVIAAMEVNHPNLTNQKTLYVEISGCSEDRGTPKALGRYSTPYVAGREPLWHGGEAELGEGHGRDGRAR